MSLGLTEADRAVVMRAVGLDGIRLMDDGEVLDNVCDGRRR